MEKKPNRALPAIVALGWATLDFGAFLAVVLLPLVLIGCIARSFVQSQSVAAHLAELTGYSRKIPVRIAVFLAQTLAILATWPLFAYFLELLSRWGYKIGWS